MKVLQAHYLLAFWCILSVLFSCGSANVKRALYGQIENNANASLKCYMKAHHLSSTHRGGPLWNEIKKLLVQTNPRRTPINLRDTDCLTGLESLLKPLRQIRKTDTTVSLCNDGRPINNHFKRLIYNLKDTISYYRTRNVVKSPVSFQLDMTALSKLAKRDAKNLVLNNGNRGVPADVLRNLQILDLIYMMSIKLSRSCV